MSLEVFEMSGILPKEFANSNPKKEKAVSPTLIRASFLNPDITDMWG